MPSSAPARPSRWRCWRIWWTPGCWSERASTACTPRGAVFERVRLAFDALVTRTAAPESPEPLYFPPLLPREQLETSGYLGSFPHLAGTRVRVRRRRGAAAELADAGLAAMSDWSGFQEMTEMVLTPAACYPLYPAVAARGPLPEGGVTLDTGDAYVFRREPSDDPARMQIFHMREIVRVADRDTVIGWREEWRAAGRGAAPRSRAGAGARRRQRSVLRSRRAAARRRTARPGAQVGARRAGGREIRRRSRPPTTTRTTSATRATLTTSDGEPAHTGCMAFGEERVTLALCSAHGLDLDAGPRRSAGRCSSSTVSHGQHVDRAGLAVGDRRRPTTSPIRCTRPGAPTWRPTATPTC